MVADEKTKRGFSGAGRIFGLFYAPEAIRGLPQRTRLFFSEA
jgi:hypothetical protein